MENNPTQSIVEALEYEEKKRDAFLNQFITIITKSFGELEKKVKENEA